VAAPPAAVHHPALLLVHRHLAEVHRHLAHPVAVHRHLAHPVAALHAALVGHPTETRTRAQDQGAGSSDDGGATIAEGKRTGDNKLDNKPGKQLKRDARTRPVETRRFTSAAQTLRWAAEVVAAAAAAARWPQQAARALAAAARPGRAPSK
jgi:hypothetical protein